jgi:hypothetical protein
MPISTLDMDVLLVFGAISNAMRGPERTFRPFLTSARTPSSVVWRA